MDYNSDRSKLPLPEYGRNLQNMVNHIMTIEDRDERNRAARTIIDIMGTMYPYLRDINDFKHKLWDHLAIMSNFTLDIDYPYTPPAPEFFNSPPERIPYSNNKIKYRHYGKTIEILLEKAAVYEDEKDRELLIKLIANHMKKSYIMWNKDSVTDDKILMDIEEMTKGKIQCSDMQLAETKDILFRSKKKISPVPENLQRRKFQKPDDRSKQQR
ncbi:MAG: DUF4290 domain-containing protein [Bacteroidota bacterium]|jgi:hypothetical protein|nr:DUF4290 domain-containing protein [Bacteroidota bacterium]MDP2112627.1 DUF4290 domain-containing protein [Bacteroidota bacterium]MDP3434364.1 DUF4290 domain-containing protein [Bacteroidota bacterium]MDP3913864.1 DUF4290 domain-containing protein [Bacteroidota bacterium]